MKHWLFVLTFFSSIFVFASNAQAVATVTFTSPDGTTLTPNAASAVDVNLNAGGDPTLGFTFRIDVTGTVPADIALNPATINGTGNALELLTNPPIVADITGGKRFTISMMSPVSDADGYTNSSLTRMATFNFTAPASGTLTFTLANTSEVTHATTYANLINTL